MNLTQKHPTLCLNMIVKNESKIITRLFDSVIDIIDCYCICDTVSTDNTVELIKSYFENKNIPGIVVSEPFKNFAHNRNFALKSAIGMSDYVLLMDADMILEIKNFKKENLQHFDSCYILQGNDDFYYQNMRIVKNNGLFTYVGVTHEYISYPNNNKLLNITKEELFIRDYGDGGCKNDKFERDIKLLLQGIINEPSNSERYHFYLANTYCDSNKLEEAIKYYEKRIEFGGWEQEVWYSYYKIGHCYKNLNKPAEAIYWWLNGYNFFPERIENLYEIVYHQYQRLSSHQGLYFLIRTGNYRMFSYGERGTTTTGCFDVRVTNSKVCTCQSGTLLTRALCYSVRRRPAAPAPQVSVFVLLY
jgi:tetratricopeptide (TPR) repeat protein